MEKSNKELGFVSEQQKVHCKPQLLWPCFSMHNNKFLEKDRHYFPGENQVKGNRILFNLLCKQEGYAPGSSEFWEAFKSSRDIVLVDMFFEEKHYNRVLYELEQIHNTLDYSPKYIRIYYDSQYNKDLQKIHSDKQKNNSTLFKKFTVEIYSFHDWDLIHDRFAVMDQEIWHFGAAVGGMSKKLSALSRGWFDKDNALRDYFDGR